RRGGDHEGDANDRFLRDGGLTGAASPAEKRSTEEGDRQRNPERDAVVEVVSHQQRDACAKCRDLRQREVDEDHLAFYNVKTEVHQQRRKEKACYEGPLHYLPRHLPISAHFCAPSPVASARTR